MNSKLFDYVERHNFIYDLSGATKLLAFLLMNFAVMYSYDIRFVAVVFIFALVCFKLSEIKFSQIKLMMVYVSIFLVLNFILTFIFNPQYGTEIYGTKHVLYTITDRYTITSEQLLYQCTKLMKYLAAVPFCIIFILATHPSEMAASISSVGISYKAAYALALTLRYFPDVIRDYDDISLAQQARGLNMSKRESLSKRVVNIFNICVPLIFSTLDRVELISNTMDLRGFGTAKKRTWYSQKKMKRNDFFSIALCICFCIASVLISVLINGSRFYNPFITR